MPKLRIQYQHIKYLSSSILPLMLLFITYSNAQQDIFEVCRSGSLNDIEIVYKSNPESVDEKNENGYLPLTLACYHKNIDVVSFLVKKVKDINGNSDYGTPLMAATYKGSSEIVKILLDNKAIPDLQDIKGETAAHYAVMFKNFDIIELLVQAEADFEIKNNKEKSPLDYAKMYNDETINKLLKI